MKKEELEEKVQQLIISGLELAATNKEYTDLASDMEGMIHVWESRCYHENVKSHFRIQRLLGIVEFQYNEHLNPKVLVHRRDSNTIV